MRKYDVKRVRYFNQHDNRYEPGGTCNLTSVASALTGFGFVGNGQGRFPDQLFLKYNHLGRHSPYTMDKVFQDYGIPNKFSYSTPIAAVTDHLKAKLPVIVHGTFTPSGHIILLKGYTNSGLIAANDSNGVIDARTGVYNTYASGENDLWTLDSLLKYVYDGDLWAHLIGEVN